MRRLRNIHPGEVLLKDFLEPLQITPYRLAKEIGVQQTRVSQIISGERAITPDTAYRLARYFNTTPRVWLNLQNRYDLEELERARSGEYERIVPIAVSVAEV